MAGSRVITGGAVKVWDGLTGEMLLELEGHHGNAGSLAFGPDGRRIVTVGFGDEQASQVAIWDASSGKNILTLRDFRAICAVYAPDGKRILSGGWDGSIRVHDAATGEPIVNWRGHDSPVNVVAVSADGSRLISGSTGSVKIWDLAIGQELLTLPGTEGAIKSVAWSPDNRFIVAADGRNALLWNATPLP
jgi:WD40 repeat protein